MNDKFVSSGAFQVKLKQKKYSFYIPVPKSVILDFDNKKGDSLFLYNVRNKNDRPAIVIYMDGKNKFGRRGD